MTPMATPLTSTAIDRSGDMRGRDGADPKNASAPVDDAAAGWRARLLSGACRPEDRAAFAKWLSEDAAHARAYGRLSDFWESLEPLKASPAVRDAMRSPARAEGGEARRAGFLVAAAASLATLLAVLFVAVTPAREYRTATGEQREIRLTDGSRVMLNTQSEIAVRYNESERRIILRSGEAGFDVARDAARPFLVNAGPVVARATGTKFDVFTRPGGARITLIEGSLEVAARNGSARADLGPGERVEAAENGTLSAVNAVALERATAWREGRLAFDDTSLADAVAEANRYSQIRIVLTDESLRSLRISGVFDAGKPETLVRALEARFGVEVAERSRDRIALKSAPAS